MNVVLTLMVCVLFLIVFCAILISVYIFSSLNRELNKHEKLIQQLYSDRDEDVNKIADQINRHEEALNEIKDKPENYENVEEGKND